MSRFSFTPEQLLENLVKETIKSVFEANPAFQDAGTAVRNTKIKPLARVPSQTFNMENFKQLDVAQKFEYAQNTLKTLGVGSARGAFKLDDKHALKVPISQDQNTISAGQKQNKAELGRCSADPEHNVYMAKVYADLSDEVDGNWLVVDLAQPMTDEAFQSLTKINWEVFESGLIGVFGKQKTPENSADAETLMQNTFFQGIVRTAKECRLVAPDLANLGNWGIVNGRPVLIDYGYTRGLVGKVQTMRIAPAGGI